MNEYLVIYEPAEDGSWGAYLPDIDGVVAAGRSRAEAEELIRGALALYLEDCAQCGAAPITPQHIAGYVSWAAAPHGA